MSGSRIGHHGSPRVKDHAETDGARGSEGNRPRRDGVVAGVVVGCAGSGRGRRRSGIRRAVSRTARASGTSPGSRPPDRTPPGDASVERRRDLRRAGAWGPGARELSDAQSVRSGPGAALVLLIAGEHGGLRGPFRRCGSGGLSAAHLPGPREGARSRLPHHSPRSLRNLFLPAGFRDLPGKARPDLPGPELRPKADARRREGVLHGGDWPE